MKLAIVGSRTWLDRIVIENHIKEFIDNKTLKEELIIVSGGAKGADTIAEHWAIKNDVKTKIFLPNWGLHGKAAGFIRNKLIVDFCDFLICFWDGQSKGCMHSVGIAKKQNKFLKLVRSKD